MSNHLAQNCAIAIYDSGAGAVEGVRALLQGGLDSNRVSIAGKDVSSAEPALGFYTSGKRTKYWAQQAESWNALSDVLCESSLFVTQNLGPIVVMGPLVGCFVATLEGIQGTIPVGLAAAALARIAVPTNRAAHYEASLALGRILVVVLGAAALIQHASDILATTRPVEHAFYREAEHASVENVSVPQSR